MRAVESAIWTSGEPVSFSPRLYSAIKLLLTAVSSAKPKWNYTGSLTIAYFTPFPRTHRTVDPHLLARRLVRR